jgi:hypothetical protein
VAARSLLCIAPIPEESETDPGWRYLLAGPGATGRHPRAADDRCRPRPGGRRPAALPAHPGELDDPGVRTMRGAAEDDQGRPVLLFMPEQPTTRETDNLASMRQAGDPLVPASAAWVGQWLTLYKVARREVRQAERDWAARHWCPPTPRPWMSG